MMQNLYVVILHALQIGQCFSVGNKCYDLTIKTFKKTRLACNEQGSLIIELKDKIELGESLIYLEFSSDIKHREDYYFNNEEVYQLPSFLNIKGSSIQRLELRLYAGKVWVPDKPVNKAIELQLLSAFACRNGTSDIEIREYEKSLIHIAILITRRKSCSCPAITDIFDVQRVPVEVSGFLTRILEDCQGPIILKTHMLTRWKLAPHLILNLFPSIVLVNGTDDSLQVAVTAMDSFLASHGVLQVVWEPFDEMSPRWWVLIPHQKGIPGHIFALLDLLQWQHPDVRGYGIVSDSACASLSDKNTVLNMTCFPGCKNTKLISMAGSGYGATTTMMTQHAITAIRLHAPFQLVPFLIRGKLSYLNVSSAEKKRGILGWPYAVHACPSDFVDCYFLDHSPCPMVRTSIDDNKPRYLHVDKQRREYVNHHFTQSEQSNLWWEDMLRRSAGKELASSPQLAVRQSVYSYPLRPKYSIRKVISDLVDRFNLSIPCVAVHIRRGDILLQRGAERGYLRLKSYLEVGRPLMNALGIRNVLVLSDSQSAIDEVLICAQEYPDICGNLDFRYIEKQRWKGSEGGFDNHYPSGDGQVEFLNIQLEFALAMKCSLAILGSSNYGDVIFNHMCCMFPLGVRGNMPGNCICPLKIQISQHSFGCSSGNKALCIEKMIQYGMNFSLSNDAFKTKYEVEIQIPSTQSLNYLHNEGVNPQISSLDQRSLGSYIKKGVEFMCAYRKHDVGSSICD